MISVTRAPGLRHQRVPRDEDAAFAGEGAEAEENIEKRSWGLVEKLYSRGCKIESPNILLLVKKAIYEHKTSPYLNLLKLAGCEYG